MGKIKYYSYPTKTAVKSIDYKYDITDKCKVIDYLRYLVEKQSPSGTLLHENFVFDLYDYIANNFDVNIEIDQALNLYITKGTSEYYPCLVAHSDTNQPTNGKPRMMIVGDIIYGMDMEYGTQCGLGFDDKAGIAIILNLLNKLNNIKVFIPADEEIGMIGTTFAMENHRDWFNDISYFIQPDRNGKNLDFIKNSNSIELYNDEFYEDCLPVINKYGYKKANGVATDVGIIKRYVDVCCVNVSVGYQREHCNDEICFISKLMCCHDMIYDLIKHLKNTVYQYQSFVESYSGYYDDWSDAEWNEYMAKLDGYLDSTNIKEEKKTEICPSCLNVVSNSKTCYYCYDY